MTDLKDAPAPAPPATADAAAPPAWSDRDLSTNPHETPDKARRVEAMFAAIAPTYDLNNRIHSFWRDQAWRRAAVAMADLKPTDRVVDVACGTGDLTQAFSDALAKLPREQKQTPPTVLGVDFTHEMLEVAHQKLGMRSGPTRHVSQPIGYTRGDAMRLPLPDASVDVVSIAFGIRNVSDPTVALAEFYRVLRPGGRVVVLEFTVPSNPVMRLGYHVYCGWVMPHTATWIARDRSGAYKYLPRSVNTFADRSTMLSSLASAGFVDPVARSLTCGIAACYRATKPD